MIDDSLTEIEAQTFLKTVSNNLWVKTSKKVGKTYEYHKELKMFSNPKPFSNWKLDVDRGIYIPPIPRPIAIPVGYVIKWSQQLKRWVLEKVRDE